MRVDEFMTTRIESIGADRSVYDAIERMVDRRIRSLLVTFSEKDSDYGVITARDIVFKVFAKGNNPRDTTVSQIVSKPIVCVDRQADVTEVPSLMAESHIARVFVCEDKKIVGVVSLLDIMAASLIIRARGDHVS